MPWSHQQPSRSVRHTISKMGEHKEKKQKKRSREMKEQEQAGPGPSSQAAKQQSDGKHHAAPKRVRVEVMDTPSTDMPALACYFPAGQPPEGAHYTLYETALQHNKYSYTLIGEKDKVSYVGRTHGEEYAGVTHTCSQVLGVYDPERGVLQLVPLAGNRIMRMEPRLPGLQYDSSALADIEAQDDEQPETREQALADNKKLVDAFGSTRRRRQLTAREEGVVRVDKLGDSADALTALMGQLAEDAAAQGLNKQQVLAQANQYRHLPPHHVDAHTPHEAYPIAELIPQEVASSLRSGALLKAAESSEELKKLQEKNLANEYIIARLPLLQDSNKNAVKTRARLLAFLGVLMNLKAGRSGLSVDTGKTGPGEGLSRLARTMRTTPEVLEPLLAMFYTANADPHTDKVTYNRGRTGDSLLLAYICVASLMAEPTASVAASHVDMLARCLKMSTSDLVQHYREVGAVCKSVNVKPEEGSPAPLSGKVKSYSATLLPDPTKTLGDCLPTLKMPTKRR